MGRFDALTHIMDFVSPHLDAPRFDLDRLMDYETARELLIPKFAPLGMENKLPGIPMIQINGLPVYAALDVTMLDLGGMD